MSLADATLRLILLGEDRTASAALARVGDNASTVQKKMASMGAAMTRAGKTMTMGITLPLVAVGAESVKAATDFNSAMTRIQTQAGGSAKDVQTLSAQILALGGKVQQTPLELASAMYHLKSVGLDNVKAMKALVQSSHLASVGNADLEDTTNAVAGAWRSGIRGAQSFHGAVKTLNAIIGAGNMTMEQLNLALGTGFLPAARTFGISLHDIGSALAVMTDEGIPANSAATRLRMTLSLLGAPSKTAAGWLSTIGIKTTELARDMRSGGLVKTFGDLKDHLASLSKVNAAELISRAFGGGRSSSAIMTLLNNFNVLKFKEDQVTKGMDKFNKSVHSQAKTPAAQFHDLISTLDSLTIRLGDVLLPDVIKAVTWIAKMATSFSQLSAPVKKVVGIFVLVLAAMGPVLLIVGGLVSALSLLFTPIGLVVAAVVGLGIAFVEAYKHSDTFRAWVQDKMLPAIKEFGQWVLSTAVPAVEQFGKKLGSELAPIVKQITAQFQKSLPTIRQFVNDVKIGAPPIIKLTGKLIELSAVVLGKVLPPLIKLSGFIDRQMMNNIGLMIRGIGETISVFGKIAGAVSRSIGAFDQWEIGVQRKIGDGVKFIGTVPGKIGSAIGNLGKLLYNAGVEVIQGLVSGIESKVSGLLSQVSGIAGKVSGAFKHALGIMSPSRVFKQHGLDIMEGLGLGLEQGFVRVTSVMSKLTSYIQAQGSKLSNLMSARSSFASGFQSFATSVFGADYGSDANGNPVAPTTGGIIAYQAQQAQQAAKVNRDVHRLVKMGLSKSLLKQLQAQGPAGLAEIQALASASPAQIRRLNDLNKHTQGSLQAAGMFAGNDIYGQQIVTTRNNEDLAKRIARELTKMNKHGKGEYVVVKIDGHELIRAIDRDHRQRAKK